MAILDDILKRRVVDAESGAATPVVTPEQTDPRALEALKLAESAKPKELKQAQRKIASIESKVSAAGPEAAHAVVAQEQAKVEAKPNMSRADKLALGLVAVLPTLIGFAAEGPAGGAIGAGASLDALKGAAADRDAGIKAASDRAAKIEDDERGLKNKQLLAQEERDFDAEQKRLDRGNARDIATIGANNRDTKRNIDLESHLRTEIVKSPQYTDLAKVNQFVDGIELAAKDPSAFGDLNTLFEFMKSVDPSSSVRESEGKMFLATSSFGDQFVNNFNQLASGRRISDKQYKDIINVVRRKQAVVRKSYDSFANTHRNVAQREGIDFKYIDPMHSSGAPAEGPAPAAAPLTPRQRLEAARAAVKGQ